ncbi:hypothetical protein DS2_10988 [Catenovulum agarivorans DS-2]|uniref:Cellulase Ig-like domain-containing protein n=1 Tax=Catenovulum agarivorans DS-2 TaxID=1328313 RepID=W7QLJ3_9ALTE|nr:hypothetical protein [Catenovulum agarivorans]EWH09807.1 hypothetical protein DS2_10988 [Catenovulum agarivorans DS-2]
MSWVKHILVVFASLLCANLHAGEQTINKLTINQQKQLQLIEQDQVVLTTPVEGLWSIGHQAKGLSELNYTHANFNKVELVADWQIFSGEMVTDQGTWQLSDSCQQVNEFAGALIKCIRRYHWTGQQTLENVVLSVRWQTPQQYTQVVMPSVVYHGNPSAKKNNPNAIAHLSQQPGEFAQFEEHRLSMPYVSLEWQNKQSMFGAAVHTIPSQIMGGNRADLWWSAGMQYRAGKSEIRLLSGPIGYNKQADRAKVYQFSSLPYANATIRVKPNSTIEKVYYLQAYSGFNKGAGFSEAMQASLAIFQPFNTQGLPSFKQIVANKTRFLLTRYMQGTSSNGVEYAGFNMFDHNYRQQLVMGWAGQSDAPGYALLALGHLNNKQEWINKAKASLDFLAQAKFDSLNGFTVNFNAKPGTWTHHAFKKLDPTSGKYIGDPVSQGQAMYMFAKAIQFAKRMAKEGKTIDTSQWQQFLLKVADYHSQRILQASWQPESTNQAFLVAPLVLASQLFENPIYFQAAVKASEHYANRHIDMNEPYWGGTLDATGEDKEGAWGAFQAFLTMYQVTKQPKYLAWAKHAAEVMLSYTVVWDIDMPAGRLTDHGFKSTGWTAVSPQNQHLDVYGVLTTPAIYQLGEYLQDDQLKQLAKVMYLSCGQLIDPYGSQGEQIQQTNFAQSKHNISQAGENAAADSYRGGYSEEWTVLWITTHFLTSAAMFEEMGVEL